MVRLRWRGTTEGSLSSLFAAPGGARRVTLASGMTALLDEGENQILVLRGRSPEAQVRPARPIADIQLAVSVQQVIEGVAESYVPTGHPTDRDGEVTGPAPALAPRSREWFVALALAEPWLTGADDYPRPPSNREIFERVLDWHGYAWNLARSQRVDDALRVIARLAFGPHDDPFPPPTVARRTCGSPSAGVRRKSGWSRPRSSTRSSRRLAAVRAAADPAGSSRRCGVGGASQGRPAHTTALPQATRQVAVGRELLPLRQTVMPKLLPPLFGVAVKLPAPGHRGLPAVLQGLGAVEGDGDNPRVGAPDGQVHDEPVHDDSPR